MKVFILCLVLVIYSLFVLNIYINKQIPIIDSAISQYLAKSMLEGKIPYKDVFDHKPPLIDAINFLGFTLSNSEPWGIWAMEFISLTIAIFISFYLLKSIFGGLPAIFGTLFWILSLFSLLEGGNLTEEYALPLQFGGILIFYLSIKYPKKQWLNITSGILFGLAFILRQNLIGVFIALIIYSTLSEVFKGNFKSLLKKYSMFTLGALVVFIPTIYYFWINNALWDFTRDAFIFNYYYSGSGRGFSNAANSIYYGFQLLSTTFIWIIALLAYFDLFAYLVYNLKRNYLSKNQFILWFIFLLLPLEMLLSSTSGRLATHYYISWLPVMGILVAYLIYVLLNKSFYFKIVTTFILGLFLIVKIVTIPSDAKTYLTSRFSFPEKKVIEYIKQNTEKEESIFVWGVGQHIYVASDRQSPTKYVYQTPLYLPGFQNETMYQELLKQLKQNRPVLVIDGSLPTTRFKPIDCKNPEKHIDYVSDFKPLSNIKVITEYICDNYQLAENDVGGFRVYKLKTVNF
jgi:hypothetical protein